MMDPIENARPVSIPPSATLSPELPADAMIAAAGPGPSTRFSRYLSSLALKPNQDPMLELDTDVAESEVPVLSHRRHGSQTIGQAGSSQSLASIAAAPADNSNPEAESFSYMETLLEALAVLGRLGAGLDNLAQRVPGEIHALVESTIDEVEDR